MSSIYLSVILVSVLSQFPVINAYGGRAQAGKRWAVIVAGARWYHNYFSQANACHAYQILRQGGIPSENIIHFNYDDIANNEANPVKNNLINTLNGTNVYDRCVIDYRREDVTPEVFLDVLTGNQTGVEVLTGKKGKVLKSGPEDEIFLYMTDHGTNFILQFPVASYLSATSLAKAFRTMYEQKMYKQMVVFLESCHSGSMFDGILPDDINIYAVTAAKPDEDGYMSCWDSFRGAFLSSIYSYNWMYTTEQLDRDEETFHQLYEKVYKACVNYKLNSSHPQEYGNTTFNKYFLSRFMGHSKGTKKSHVCTTVTSSVMDQNILKELSNEFTFPFKEEVLSPLFLESPPIDMVSVATVIRRPMSKTLTQDDKESLKAELNQMLKIEVMARGTMAAVEEDVTKVIENSPSSMKYVDRIETAHCYNETRDGITSHCPALQAHRFPFINRNFKSLINLCERAGKEVVVNAVVTGTIKSCRAY